MNYLAILTFYYDIVVLTNIVNRNIYYLTCLTTCYGGRYSLPHVEN